MAQLENFRLKVFRTVAEHLSFRRAAEHLFLSQPAVTLQIKALEDELGVRLFDRSGGRITLTRQGSILLGYANQVADLVADAERQLGDNSHEASGELLLGVSTTIGQYVLPRLLGAFLADHPRVQFSLTSGNTDEIVHLLLAGKIAVGLIEGPTHERGVHVEPLMDDELVLIAPVDFPADVLLPAHVEKVTLLMREQGSGSRRVVESSLKKAGYSLKSFQRVIDMGSTEAIKSAVEAGLGVGLVSHWAVSKETELNAVKIITMQGVTVTRQFTLISPSGPEPQGPAGAFRRFALDRSSFLSSMAPKPKRTPRRR